MLWFVALSRLFLGFVMTAQADAPPAISANLERPDLILKHVIDLFEGSRATDPAAALAAWKLATNGSISLGKGTEAAIAALNPRMIPELANLEAARAVFDFDPAGKPDWSFTVSHDDGTFSAFATAMALTDGAREPEIDGADVDRTGPPGSAMIANKGDAVIVASSREAIARALKTIAPVAKPSDDAGIVFAIDADALIRAQSVSWKRAGEAMKGLNLPKIDGRLKVDADRLFLAIETPAAEPGAIQSRDRAWDRELSNRASIVFSTSLDTSPKNLDQWFAMADRVEKADPAKSKLNPLRARVNILATASRINLERDLWPHLRGVSGFLLGDSRRLSGIGIALHMRDKDSAMKIRRDVLPSLMKALRLDQNLAVSVIESEGATAWIVWGEKAREELAIVRSDPRLSITAAAEAKPPENENRMIVIHPGRLGLATEGSPLDRAVAEAPPIIWRGSCRDGKQTDRVTIAHFRPMIKRFLDEIPQKAASAPAR